MKHFLLIIIRLYWITIPESKRNKCLFRKSCSRYVFDITTEQGFIKGVKAFYYRFKNCRHGSVLYTDSVTGKKKLVLPNNQIVEEHEIAEYILQF